MKGAGYVPLELSCPPKWGTVTSYMIGDLAGRAVGLQRGADSGRARCMGRYKSLLETQYVSDRYRSQNKVIGGGRIRSNSLMSIPLKDLFLTLLVWISRLVR